MGWAARAKKREPTAVEPNTQPTRRPARNSGAAAAVTAAMSMLGVGSYQPAQLERYRTLRPKWRKK